MFDGLFSGSSGTSTKATGQFSGLFDHVNNTTSAPKTPAYKGTNPLKQQLAQGKISKQDFLKQFSQQNNAPTDSNPYSAKNVITGGVHGLGTGLKEIGQGLARTAIATPLATVTQKTLTPNKAGAFIFGKEPVQTIQQQGEQAAASHPGGFHIKGTKTTLTPTQTGLAESLLSGVNTLSTIVAPAKGVLSKSGIDITAGVKNTLDNVRTNGVLETAKKANIVEAAKTPVLPELEPKTVAPPEVAPVETPPAQPVSEPVQTPKQSEYSPGSQRLQQAFSKSTGHVEVASNDGVKFEIGSMGKNQLTKKGGQADRFDNSELPATIKNIKSAYRASDNPKSYRYDNIAWVSKMPDGEKRVIYTRQNANGAEEIINAHSIQKTPTYEKGLASFGSPDGSRTRIEGLEAQQSNPLTYKASPNVAETTSSVKPVTQPTQGAEAVVATPKVEEPAPVEKPAEPNKTSGVAKSIEAKAIEKKLTTGFKDLAGFEGKNVKEQAGKVSDLITSDPEKMRRIVNGDESVPEGMSGSMFIKGVEEHALQNNDTDLLRSLASSPITSETSIHASELRLLAEREPDSAVAKMRELASARKQAFETKAKTTVSKAVRATAKEIKAAIPKVKEEDWDNFLAGLKC